MAEILVNWQALKAFTKEVFIRVGMSPEDADTQAEVLVWANLRGVDSHGVLRIPSYVASAESGGMNPKPDIRFEKETAATAFIEADHAFGPVVTTMAMRCMINKAKDVGIGWALIRNTTHQGAMAYYPLMAAEAGMAGIAIVCSPPNMAPYGARAAGLHNSPISIAVPAKSHRPVVLDIATSVAAGGKVQLAQDKRAPLPDGWALDSDGNPTTDPFQAKILLPFGAYKGSGMAMMFECLTSIMAGNPLVEPTLLENNRPTRGTQNSVVAAVNIGLFGDVDAYREHVDKLIEGIKGLPKADGCDEVLVPGELEDRVREQRMQDGVPLPEGTVSNLRGVAAKLGVALPPGL